MDYVKMKFFLTQTGTNSYAFKLDTPLQWKLVCSEPIWYFCSIYV